MAPCPSPCSPAIAICNRPPADPRPQRGSRTSSRTWTVHMPIHPASFSTPLPQDGFSFCCFLTRRGGQGRDLGCVTARKGFRTFTSIKLVLPRDEQTHTCLLTELTSDGSQYLPCGLPWTQKKAQGPWSCRASQVAQR